MNYEKEQKALKESIPQMEEQLNTEKDKSEGLQHFIDKAKRLTHLIDLTPEILHEFIEKIVVSKPYKIDGKRHQDLDIYYNGLGIRKDPSPEQMEEYFQEHILNNKQKHSNAILFKSNDKHRQPNFLKFGCPYPPDENIFVSLKILIIILTNFFIAIDFGNILLYNM